LYRQCVAAGVSAFHRPGLSFPLAANGAAMLANGRFGPRVPAPSLHGARKKNWAEEAHRGDAPGAGACAGYTAATRAGRCRRRARQVASARRLLRER